MMLIISGTESEHYIGHLCNTDQQNGSYVTQSNKKENHDKYPKQDTLQNYH